VIEILTDPQNWPAWFLFFVAFVFWITSIIASKDD